ncbi:MAG: hypothetical protein ACRC5R_06135 [Mycoplasmatales bacterium]
MSKTYGLIGTIENEKVCEMIQKEISAFLDIEYKIGDVNVDVYVLKQTEGKINSEDVMGYIDNLTSNSFNASNKVGIIYDFHLLSIANQNKLLKTIEDNRDTCMQLFITNEENKIIRTIISRIITFKFCDTDTLNFTDIELENSFYKDIIINQKELLYIREANDANTIKVIYKMCNEKEFIKPYILFTTQLTELNETNVILIMRILFTLTYKLKLFSLLKTLLEYEQRATFQINKKLMIESMFVEIHKELVWKE